MVCLSTSMMCAHTSAAVEGGLYCVGNRVELRGKVWKHAARIAWEKAFKSRLRMYRGITRARVQRI